MSRLGIVSRALSLLIAGAFTVLCLLGGGPKAAEVACLVLLFPLALIWFPEPIGAATGYLGHAPITVETPPLLVAFMGWVFLLGPVVLAVLTGR